MSSTENTSSATGEAGQPNGVADVQGQEPFPNAVWRRTSRAGAGLPSDSADMMNKRSLYDTFRTW